MLDLHDPKDEDIIISAKSYLSRYHASQRILKAYGIKIGVTEIRKVFPLITDNHIEGLNEEEIKHQHIRARNNLLNFIQNYDQPLTYTQMKIEELEDAFLDECYKNKPKLKVLRQLVKLGVKVSVPFDSGAPAYVRGIVASDYENLNFFLIHGADINYQYPNLERNGQPYYLTLFLRFLHSSKSHENIALMLKHGAKPLDKNGNGENCLHLLSHPNITTESITLLIDAGVDPNAKNLNGESCLHYLAEKINILPALELVLKKGADPNLRNNLGKTPIYYSIAKQFDSKKTIEVLVRYGAQLNIVDETGDSPLHLAAHRNREQAVAQLLKEGADPKLKDQKGKTAYEIALEKGHLDLAKHFNTDAEKDYKARAAFVQIQQLKEQTLQALNSGKTWQRSDKEGWATIGADQKGLFYHWGEHLSNHGGKNYFKSKDEFLAYFYQQATSWRDRNEKTELDCWKIALNHLR